MEEKLKFAVYGTLKRGYGNNVLLQDATFIGTHITEPEYTMYQCGFPVVVEGGTTPITCEIFETDNENVINRVNSLEGFTGTKDNPNNWYDRKTIQTKYGPAEMFYMKEHLNRPVITSGEWSRSR